MQCAKCGSPVTDGVIFCPACGEFLETLSAEPAKPSSILEASGEKKQLSKSMRIALAGLGIIGLLAVLGLYAMARTEENSSAKARADARTPIAVSAMNLSSAYENDAASAQRSYGDRPLLVSGIVHELARMNSNHPAVLLKTRNEFKYAHASLAEDAKNDAHKFTSGSTILLLCNGVTESSGSLMLQECRSHPGA